ncbi:MAG: hypothetical protein AUG51_24905 [Acidobacteria bacterium 13_1_20CM_3_53_8]|nr:MAG: hypothetical protein AUG51_24905 [Acidobacteria bacterium 13_1_20CM_3_53_8]
MVEIPFNYDLLTYDERHAEAASLRNLLRFLRRDKIERVFIPGCFVGGEDVQFWLRRGVKRLDGIDVLDLNTWPDITQQLAEHFMAKVNFKRASIEEIPFESGYYDLLCTRAVLEHVHNLDAAARETARILRPGGWAWHEIGPLYYTHSGDHCISSYGDEHGYDHLLLDEHEYKAMVCDQEFYSNEPDPYCSYWAQHDQFSFALPDEYIETFTRYFNIRHTVLKLSGPGLWFREEKPEEWSILLDAGLRESDLLVKSIVVILQKHSTSLL